MGLEYLKIMPSRLEIAPNSFLDQEIFYFVLFLFYSFPSLFFNGSS